MPVQTGKNAVFVPEPPDEAEKKTGPLAPSTMLVFARTWVESVAQDPNKPAAERERLLGQAGRRTRTSWPRTRRTWTP